MRGMRLIRHVLVANELASYRESIAAVLRASFPDVEVFEATSAELNREVLRLRPELVICSRVTSLVKDRAPNWVELYPECEPLSTFCLDGECSVREQVYLSDLLSIVDPPSVPPENTKVSGIRF
jgi:hypothetical protein